MKEPFRIWKPSDLDFKFKRIIINKHLGKGDREARRVYLAERSAMEGKPWFSLWRAEHRRCEAIKRGGPVVGRQSHKLEA